MKTLFILLSGILMVAACNKSVDKKQELADLKNQAKEINAKIIALESAMG
jgi:protein involved in sex pheromone biosynthesis